MGVRQLAQGLIANISQNSNSYTSSPVQHRQGPFLQGHPCLESAENSFNRVVFPCQPSPSNHNPPLSRKLSKVDGSSKKLPPFGSAWGPPVLLRQKDGVVSLQGQILVNGMALEEMEVAAKNGRIYTLRGVLIPPSIIPILPHRCDETKREMRLVRKLGNSIRGP